MKAQTRIAISTLLSAAGAVLTALSAEFAGESTTTTEPSTPAEPQKTRKPREPKAEKPPEPAAPAEEATQPAEETTEAPPSGVMTLEELKALIEPFVKGGQGADVKKLIAKYDPDSATPSIKTMPAKNHAAFEKDIQALGY